MDCLFWVGYIFSRWFPFILICATGFHYLASRSNLFFLSPIYSVQYCLTLFYKYYFSLSLLLLPHLFWTIFFPPSLTITWQFPALCPQPNCSISKVKQVLPMHAHGHLAIPDIGRTGWALWGGGGKVQPIEWVELIDACCLILGIYLHSLIETTNPFMSIKCEKQN